MTVNLLCRSPGKIYLPVCHLLLDWRINGICWQELGCCFSDTLANFGHIPFPLSRWRSATPSSWRGSTVMGSRAVGRPLSWWASFSNAHHSLKVLEFLYAFNFFSLIIHDITQHRLQLSWFGGLFHNCQTIFQNKHWCFNIKQ